MEEMNENDLDMMSSDEFEDEYTKKDSVLGMNIQMQGSETEQLTKGQIAIFGMGKENP